MIIIVVVIYAVCWLPLHVITLIGDNNPRIYSMPHMNVVWLCAHWLAMSHSCYNPIVYFSLNSTFRKNLVRVFALCWYKRKRIRRHFSARSDISNGGVEISDNEDSVKKKSLNRGVNSSVKSVKQKESSNKWDSFKQTKMLRGVSSDMHLWNISSSLIWRLLEFRAIYNVNTSLFFTGVEGAGA